MTPYINTKKNVIEENLLIGTGWIWTLEFYSVIRSLYLYIKDRDLIH